MKEVSEVPIWVVASLGKDVVLARDFVGPCATYSAGCRGKLISIQAPLDGHDLYVTVALDPDDICYEENFRIDDIRPVSGDMGTFYYESGIIVF